MDEQEKNLQETKQEIKRLLEKKNEGALIYLLNLCVNDEKLEKEFEDMRYDTCIDLPKDEKEKFERLEWSVGKSNDYYWASNLGRIAIGNEKKPNKIIPQCQDEKWNWKLTSYVTEQPVYLYFMEKTTWLKDEYEKIKKEYPNYCKFVLHHICNKGDNRIDNLVYLPKCIHDKVNHNYKA